MAASGEVVPTIIDVLAPFDERDKSPDAILIDGLTLELRNGKLMLPIVLTVRLLDPAKFDIPLKLTVPEEALVRATLKLWT